PPAPGRRSGRGLRAAAARRVCCACRRRPTMSRSPRIAFLASTAANAQQALATLVERHGQCRPEEAEILCALGGDGFMLQTLHRHGGLGKPVYGMKLGTVGVLMNHYRAEDAADARLERLAAAEPAGLRPLEMGGQTASRASVGSLAYNHGPAP